MSQMSAPSTTYAPWTTAAREAWLEEASAWVRAKLASYASTSGTRREIVRERPWAIVVRFDSKQGAFYFKASASGGAHEPALVEYLSGSWPRVVPTPVAVDRDAGWVLMPHRGVTARAQGRSPVALWKALLPMYARIQIASAADCELLLASGVPDRRPHRLPLLLRDLLEDPAYLRATDDLSHQEQQAMLEAIPRLERDCARLAASGIADGIDHGDLHDGNLLIEDTQTWLVDWADSSITHPLCSLLVTLDVLQGGKLELAADDAVALRDVYLAEWERLAPRSLLDDLFPVAMRVGHVIRALDWDRMLANAPADARAGFEPYVVRWLRRWYDGSA